MISHNLTNSSIENFVKNCKIEKTFSNASELYACYKYFAKQRLALTIFEWTVASLAVLLNLLVVMSLFCDSRKKKTCFDKVLVGYCLVNGATGLLG